MRRLVVSVIVASGLVLTGAGAAFAEQAPSAGAAQAAAGKKVCKIEDERLAELSGIVATDDGFIVINDSSDQSSRRRVFFLDDRCEVVDDVSYSGDGPRDTEDMVLSPDGKTLWIADIGDNAKNRRTVGLWSMPVDGSRKPKIHRLVYPDGKHDAEALLLDGDGDPIIVTKEFGRPAALYTPTAQLKTENSEGVPMRKVGEVTVPPSETSGTTVGRLGRATIDGGAVALGGSKVVLRTYTDALEWSVSGGDVLTALKGEPRVTPLPDEPFGEAITYSPDGKYFYTVSDMGDVQEDTENYILRYTPVAKTAVTRSAADGGSGGGDNGPSWFDNLSINDITYIVGGVGVLGAILVGFGIFGIMRARKRPPSDPDRKGGDAPDGPKPEDAETELLTVGGAAAGRGSGVYGGNRPAAGPGVYGGKPAPPPAGGGSYGGRPAQGGGRPGGGQPAVRPGAGQPAGRPGGGQPAVRPGAGQPAGRPGPAQPVVRPGGQPAGHPGAGQPAVRPGGGQPAGRPGGGGGQPAGRPGGQGQPAVRPGGGGQPAGRPPQGGRPAPGGGQQPMGRPGQGGGQGGGQPDARPGQGGGVYGAPPQHPQGPARSNSAGPVQRPSGFFGTGHQTGGYQAGGYQAGGYQGGGGYPEAGRPAPGGLNGYADSQGGSRDFDNPGYGRGPFGR